MPNLRKITELDAYPGLKIVPAISYIPTRILVVEDDKANLMLTCLWLDEFGFQYDKAVNGEEAIEKYKSCIYDIILMDVQMSKLDGYEATKAIREYEEKNSLKPSFIIALTANALMGDREKCLKSGMDDYISKPVNFKELRQKLEQYHPFEKELLQQPL